jgi:hypothetical protein
MVGNHWDVQQQGEPFSGEQKEQVKGQMEQIFGQD